MKRRESAEIPACALRTCVQCRCSTQALSFFLQGRDRDILIWPFRQYLHSRSLVHSRVVVRRDFANPKGQPSADAIRPFLGRRLSASTVTAAIRIGRDLSFAPVASCGGSSPNRLTDARRLAPPFSRDRPVEALECPQQRNRHAGNVIR